MPKKGRKKRPVQKGSLPSAPVTKEGAGNEATPESARSTTRYRLLWIILGICAFGAVAVSLIHHHANNGSARLDSTGNSIGQSSPLPRFEDFVGAESCARCHQKQYDLWKNSTHGQAGGAPGEARIIARFDGHPLVFKDAVVTPTTNRAGDYIFIVERPDAPRREIKVHAVVGGGHMYGGGTQSFFEKFSDGTVRFLPFDFIRRENLWFVQLRNDKTWAPISRDISLETDLANWTPNRVLGTLTEFSNCQNCHGSQIAVQYDPKNLKYDTRYHTLRIDCESCHGPARRHIEIVSQPGFEKVADLGMMPLATLSKDQSLLVCFRCHATKDTIREAPYLPGADLESYFSLKLPAFSETFTVDGRIRSFGYQSTHLYSDCYLDGSMTCVDCHDPHSQQYRDVFGKPLVGRFDNGQCTGCHASKALSPELHSHHKPDSLGNLCTSCHMPFLQHRGLGTQLAFARSDHGIPIPRPAFDQSIGIENACQKCHADKDLAWQEKHTKNWYGELKPHHPIISNLIKAAETIDPVLAAKLLLNPGIPGRPAQSHPMAQMDGLVTYIKTFIRPTSSVNSSSSPDHATEADRDVVAKLRQFAESDDLDLRSMGLMALHLGFDQTPKVRAYLDEQLKPASNGRTGLPDAVKDRWSVGADYVGNNFAAHRDLGNAAICYRKSLEIRPDNVVVMSHLALALLGSGDFDNGVQWLKNAIKVKPQNAVLHFQLAQAYGQARKTAEAIQALEEGLKFAPDDPNALRMLQYLRGQ